MKYSLYDMAISRERSKAGLELKTIEIGGRAIAVLESAKGAGKPSVVLLHGFAANKENWVRFSAHLTDDFHVVAMDLPGHGQSVKDFSMAYDIDDQVGYVRDILDRLNIETCHMAGNSMGGAIAALFAATYPEAVQSLTLLNPAGIYRHESELMRLLAEGKNPLIVKDREDFDFLLDFALERRPLLPWPIISVFAEQAIANRAINERIYADIRGEHDYAFEKSLESIQAPALVIWGKEDRIVDVGNAAVFSALIPDARKVVLDGIGHAPMIEDPGKTARIFRDFVGSL